MFFSFAPEPRTNIVIESLRRLKQDHGQLCLDYTREKLKDPGSIRMIEWHDDKNEYGSFIYLKYKASNSYGAYVEGTQKCYVGMDGIDKNTIETVEVIERLEKQNSISQEKIGKIATVTQTMNSGDYTYIEASDQKGVKVWLATPKMKIATGNKIIYKEVPPILNFQSKTLKKTFDKIYFIIDVHIVK
jgi:hypothetical protein